ncbi:hypothetical protein ASD31_07765 [Rhizobium sp. Root482]|nr:hypothetical protein ASD31_07765 [Rhizobium sp. Root482]
MVDRGLAPDDFDLFVLDLIDDGLDIGLAEGNVAGGDVFAHHPAELLDDGRRDIRGGHGVRSCAIERRLDSLAVDLEPGDTIAQDVIHFGDPVLDHRVDALEPGFNLRQFPLQTNDPTIDLGGFAGAGGVGTGVVAMDRPIFRRAGPQRHAAAAGGTSGKPRQKDRPRHDARGVTFGFLSFSIDCTASNSSRSMIAGTETITCSETGFAFSVRESRRLNAIWPI